MLRPIAEAGYPVVIVKQPYNLAVLDGSAADSVIGEGDDEVKRWVVGCRTPADGQVRCDHWCDPLVFRRLRRPERRRHADYFPATSAESDRGGNTRSVGIDRNGLLIKALAQVTADRGQQP